jgi:hypothetical protein
MSTPADWQQDYERLAVSEFGAAGASAEPQYREDPGAAANVRFAEQLFATVAADCAALEQAGTENGVERLRHVRLEIAATLAALRSGTTYTGQALTIKFTNATAPHCKDSTCPRRSPPSNP